MISNLWSVMQIIMKPHFHKTTSLFTLIFFWHHIFMFLQLSE
uniref:Uncharacterized protein n=1 Tax=Arundo donax TaxID=35708 RepID=A0A0A9FPR7_ARUDO